MVEEERGRLEIESSLLERAKNDDEDAIRTMFKQFIPDDERILFAAYLGVHGMWWVGKHSFALLTNRRLASLRVGSWGEVVYQDGLLEHQNSGVVYQPSVLSLYVLCGIWLLFWLFTGLGSGAAILGAILFVFPGLVLLPYLVQFYYRLNKCGLVWSIREGISIYLFTNRNRLTTANSLYRLASFQHDRRLAELPASAPH